MTKVDIFHDFSIDISSFIRCNLFSEYLIVFFRTFIPTNNPTLMIALYSF